MLVWKNGEGERRLRVGWKRVGKGGGMGRRREGRGWGRILILTENI